MVFTSWLAPSLIPHREVCLSLPTLGACCAWGWVDIPSPPRTSRTLSTAWLVVSTVAPMASSDRHSVALALSSSLSVATDPLLLRYAWWSLSLGWFLNLSLQRVFVMTFLTWTLDLSVLITPTGLWLQHLRPWLVCVVLCPCSLLCYSHLFVTAHPAVLVIVWNRAM